MAVKPAMCNNSSLTTTHSARNLGIIFDEYFTFSDQISSVSKSSYYYHIRQLCCICPYLDTKTASTITTFIVHSKLDYCNSITTCPSLRSPGSNRSRTLVNVLLSKLLDWMCSFFVCGLVISYWTVCGLLMCRCPVCHAARYWNVSLCVCVCVCAHARAHNARVRMCVRLHVCMV